MSKSKINVRLICFVAVMTALFAVLDLVSIKLGNNIKITFSGLPICIAAVYLGPVPGMIAGLAGSFIGQMLSYGFTATTVLWILPAGIRGLAMGLLFIAFKRSLSFKFIALEVTISSLLVTFVNTFVIYLDSKIYGYYSYPAVFGMVVPRVISSILTAIVLSVLLLPIIKALKKTLPESLSKNVG